MLGFLPPPPFFSDGYQSVLTPERDSKFLDLRVRIFPSWMYTLAEFPSSFLFLFWDVEMCTREEPFFHPDWFFPFLIAIGHPSSPQERCCFPFVKGDSFFFFSSPARGFSPFLRPAAKPTSFPHDNTPSKRRHPFLFPATAPLFSPPGFASWETPGKKDGTFSSKPQKFFFPQPGGCLFLFPLWILAVTRFRPPRRAELDSLILPSYAVCRCVAFPFFPLVFPNLQKRRTSVLQIRIPSFLSEGDHLFFRCVCAAFSFFSPPRPRPTGFRFLDGGSRRSFFCGRNAAHVPGLPDFPPSPPRRFKGAGERH